MKLQRYHGWHREFEVEKAKITVAAILFHTSRKDVLYKLLYTKILYTIKSAIQKKHKVSDTEKSFLLPSMQKSSSLTST